MLFHKFLYREFWRIKKINEENNSEEDNISFDDKKENEINIIDRKIQNRTNTKNVYERVKKFNPKEDNKWIRLNKSSILVDPIKDDQIQAVNKYEYKDNEIYKNKNNFIRDYQNDTNLNKNAAPPKKLDKKNNNYYHMEKNHDLINSRTVKPITSSNYDDIQTMLAIVEGLVWCTEQGIKDIIVVCSDEIICKWANGTYKARKPNGRKFVNFISNLDIKYIFVKDYVKVYINLNRAKCIAERGYAYDCLDRQ
jgi:hypothetical protein